MMDINAFRAGLAADGFTEVLESALAPGQRIETHSHAWDARLMVLEGTVTLSRADGSSTLFERGQWCEVPRNEPHAEAYGPEGTTLLIGRRH